MSETESRMTLSNIRTGKRPAPDRILMLGTEGVGKSTFASDAPSPIFIAAEDGIRHLDVHSFPEPRTFAEVGEAIKELVKQDHNFETVVIDTIDWVEPLIAAAVCKEHNWKTLDEPGFQEGPNTALDWWRRILSALDILRARKNMTVILLAHVHISAYRNPRGPDYDRFWGKLNKKAYGLVKEWADMVLFADFEEFTVEGKGFGKGKFKGVSSGRRVMHTQRTAAFDAKNRHDLPDVLPLSWDELQAGMSQEVDFESMSAEALALLEAAGLSAEQNKLITTGIDTAVKGNSHTNLRRIIDRLRTRVTEKGEG